MSKDRECKGKLHDLPEALQKLIDKHANVWSSVCDPDLDIGIEFGVDSLMAFLEDYTVQQKQSSKENL